jgi:flagellar motor switch protein FliM
MEPGGKIILVEIKSTDKLSRDDFNSFAKIAKEFPKVEKYVLSNTARSFHDGDIQYLHWGDGLKKIFEIE